MINPNNRSRANLAMLEFIARKLATLKDEFVFVGGCTTALLIDDPVAPDVRTTIDVDCIVDVLSLKDYHRLSEQLRALGFRQSSEDTVICRWRYEEVILDVMPTDEKILGFSNQWYKSAITYAVSHHISDEVSIKSVTTPYFLATKWEAFNARGNGDYMGSHDFEDIIAVIDGRLTLLDEIASAQVDVKQYVATVCAQLLQNSQFSACLPGHLNYGAATSDRTNMVLNRIRRLASMAQE